MLRSLLKNKTVKATSLLAILTCCALYYAVQKTSYPNSGSQISTFDLDTLLKKCPMYQELSSLNFLHPTIRYKLCHNAVAYKRYPNGYPMCLLKHPFDEDMLSTVRQGSELIELIGVEKIRIPIFVYKGMDLISEAIRYSGSWEPDLVYWTLRFALKLPDVTFLDVGSKIGVYSLQAAKLGLPVVSLDANIGNLLRLRLSLNAASLDATLVWNFISPDEKLKYLSFLGDCNVGAAEKNKEIPTDTVPVMPMRSERISDVINTKNVVMKLDIQGGEADFLQTSGRLFTDFNVAAVQMEWQILMMRGNDSAFLVSFFTNRGYKCWRLPGFYPLDLDSILLTWILSS